MLCVFGGINLCSVSVFTQPWVLLKRVRDLLEDNNIEHTTILNSGISASYLVSLVSYSENGDHHGLTRCSVWICVSQRIWTSCYQKDSMWLNRCANGYLLLLSKFWIISRYVPTDRQKEKRMESNTKRDSNLARYLLGGHDVVRYPIRLDADMSIEFW